MSPLNQKRTHSYFFTQLFFYIGGAIPFLPTVIRSACNTPSASFFTPGMNTLALGFRSLRSPGTRVTTLVLGVVVTTFVPPLYSTVRLLPSTLLTLFSPILLGFCATVPLVMLLFGVISHARFPSPVPRIDSGKMWISIACSVPSVVGVAAVPIKLPGLTSDKLAAATDAILALSPSRTLSDLPSR